MSPRWQPHWDGAAFWKHPSGPCSALSALTHFPCPHKLTAFPRKVVWKLPTYEGSDLALWGPAALTVQEHKVTVTGTMAETSPPTLLSGGARQTPEREFHISMKDVILCEHPMVTHGSGCTVELCPRCSGEVPRSSKPKIPLTTTPSTFSEEL